MGSLAKSRALLELEADGCEVSSPGAGDLTRLLREWRRGSPTALERLVPRVYGELRRLAQYQLAGEGRELTLQATALVHEAYLRLADKGRPNWRDRSHFFAVAALLMRRILIDNARKARSLRHGGGAVKVELEDGLPGARLPAAGRPEELLALDQALRRLGRRDRRRARIVELRFFGGLTLDEVADVLEVSQATVVREWRVARAWLFRELQGRR